jgi:two-component system response regulator PilR (NtrC family)
LGGWIVVHSRFEDARAAAPAELRVLVCDPHAGRRAALCEGAAALGAAPRALEEPSGEIGTAFDAAVVATDDPAPGSPALRLVQALAARGVAVLACAHGAGAWPVTQRCLPLLAGARHVLDSAEAGFGRELAARLEPVLAAARVRRQDAVRIEEEMVRLGVVGRSRAMLEVFQWVLRIAPLSDLPALLLGETGAGKEVLARAIHRLDPKRSRGPFVPVNCAALTRSIAESELFGHRRGAFTGADRERPGLVRAASAGVLFLDEIGELDLELQGKLLRVLQEGRVLGVGHDQEVPVDVRVVVATHRDLAELVQSGRFREDLFHRLSVLPVRIPPLRERPDDVAPLVEHFLAKNRALCLRPLRAGPGFIEALARLPLAGNVRELENLVRRAMASKDDASDLDLGDLPPETWRALAEPGPSRRPDCADPGANAAQDTPAAGAPPGTGPDPFLSILAAHGWKLSGSLQEVERIFLSAALRRTQGNQTETARLLGLSARSVYTKIRKHNLHA